MTQQPPEEPGTWQAKVAPWQAKVFVAYASEDRNVALAIQGAIEKYAASKEGGSIVVDTWEVKTKPSKSILENLQSTIKEGDFGIFIYSPVDVKARDNVVFETGLFMGIKNADHTIILLPENHEVTPSDLEGILGPKYPYDELKDMDDHARRTGKLGGVGAVIVDRIYDVMDQSPRYQEQSDTGQPRSGASKGHPSSALEMISVGLATQAALGKLMPLDGDVWPGRFVVHAAKGVGQVVGFDPLGEEPRYIEVQFGSIIGRYRMSQLFVAPINF